MDDGPPIRVETVHERIVVLCARIHQAEPGLIMKQLEVLDLKLKAWREGGIPLGKGYRVAEKRVVGREIELYR
jgi:hypothetical protein